MSEMIRFLRVALPLPRAVVRRLLLLAAGNLVLLVVIGLQLKEGSSFQAILSSAVVDRAPTLLAALGMTGIILCGAIDLSIASVVAASGTVFGVLAHHGQPPLLCHAACFATACLLSLVNGWLVRGLKIPPIIVTLAGYSIYRGLALIAGRMAIPGFGGSISITDDAYHGPGKVYAGWILLAGVVLAVSWEALGRTPRLWRARGSSEDACRLQGLQPGRILQSSFLAGGIFLGLASVVLVTQIQSIEPARMALGFELPVIGAVVLGGTNIFGGEGSYLGSIAGAFLLYFAEQLLVYTSVPFYYREVIIGGAILLVIGLDCLAHRRRKRMEELR
jgi:ribose/xylose/arabinose/galactoside ABC-type transport system permease subunit